MSIITINKIQWKTTWSNRWSSPSCILMETLSMFWGEPQIKPCWPTIEEESQSSWFTPPAWPRRAPLCLTYGKLYDDKWMCALDYSIKRDSKLHTNRIVKSFWIPLRPWDTSRRASSMQPLEMRQSYVTKLLCLLEMCRTFPLLINFTVLESLN